MNRSITDKGFSTKIGPIPGHPDVNKVLVQGRITYHEAPEFREVILGEVLNTNASALVVELGGVKHIDTAGLAVLVEGLLVEGFQGTSGFLIKIKGTQ